MTLINQQISNHKAFTEVKRTLHIIGFSMDAEGASFQLYYRITYNREEQDITHMFNMSVPKWSVDNNNKMLVRGEDFKPLLNPEFKEREASNLEDKYITMPAFDYVKMMILDKNVPLKTLLSAYIAEEDKGGRFDF